MYMYVYVCICMYMYMYMYMYVHVHVHVDVDVDVDVCTLCYISLSLLFGVVGSRSFQALGSLGLGVLGLGFGILSIWDTLNHIMNPKPYYEP